MTSTNLPDRYQSSNDHFAADTPAHNAGLSRSCCDCLTRALNLWRAGTVMSKPLHSNLLFMSFGTHWHTHGSRSRRRFDFHELLMLNQYMTDEKRLCSFRSCMCVLLILQNKRVKSSTIDLFSLYFSIFFPAI